MPFLDHKLITQQLSPGSSGDKLRPVLLDGNAGSSGRAPQVNVNAGNVRFAGIEPPKIVVDSTLTAVADMSKVWVDSALKYQETVSSLKAEETYLQTELAVKDMAAKYLQTQTGKAVDSYASFSGALEKTIQESMMSVDEATRSKLVPSLARLKSNTTIAASEHKAKQTNLWKQEVLNAKEIAARQNLVETSNDPKQFMAVVGQHLQNIGAQESKSAEAIQIEQSKFYSGILGDVISTHIAKGKAAVDFNQDPSAHFKTAMDYIEIGSSKDFKADGEMLAKQTAALGNAFAEINASRRTKERQERADKKDADEEAMKGIVSQAIKQGNPAALGKIIDPELKAKAIGWYNTSLDGTDTPPEALTALYKKLDSVESTAELFDEGIKLGVHPKKIAEIHGKMESLRKEDKQDVIKDIKTFARSLVPGGDMFDKFEKAEQAQQYNSIVERLTESVRMGQMNKIPPKVALQDAKTALMNDKNFDANFAQVKLHRERLASALISGIPNDGMMHLDNEADLTGLVTTPSGKQVTAIDNAYNAAAYNLRVKYGLDKLTTQEVLAQLGSNEQLSVAFKTDMSNLAMQRRYYLKKSTSVAVDINKGKRPDSKSKESNKGY